MVGGDDDDRLVAINVWVMATMPATIWAQRLMMGCRWVPGDDKCDGWVGGRAMGDER